MEGQVFIMIERILRKTIYLKDLIEYHVFQKRYPLLNRIYRRYSKGRKAKGVVLMLHRVCERVPGHVPNNEHLKISPDFLETVILKYKKAGFSFISLNQLYNIMSNKNNLDKPFVCFTIDDGYLDNFQNAYPIFKKYKIPFAIFVASDFPDKKAVLWWYVIEELIMKSSVLKLSDGSEYTCSTFQEKWDAFRFIREKVLQLDQQDLVNELNKLFANYVLDWQAPVQELAMDWEQIKALTQEPLCTIGSHTVSHVALNKLSLEDLDYEVMHGIQNIKSHTGYEPEYFAYPYGSDKENGDREYNYIRKSDIKMAFISHGGFVFSDSQIEQIPRVMLI